MKARIVVGMGEKSLLRDRGSELRLVREGETKSAKTIGKTSKNNSSSNNNNNNNNNNSNKKYQELTNKKEKYKAPSK